MHRSVDEILKLIGARQPQDVSVGRFLDALTDAATHEALQAAVRFAEQHRVAKCGRVETAISVDEMLALESAGAQRLT
jgi:hypothetical protein